MATDVERLKPVGPLADWMRSNTSNIPMLPEVAARVITLASSPDVTISHLAQLITKDQVLTTRLLSLANSAHYMSSIDVTTVPEAIMRMGAGAVRNVAVTLCVTSCMRDRNVYGAHGQLLVDHGLGTAYVARLVADDAGADPEQAFLCGLLHDIGKMVILKWHYDHVKRTGQAMDAAELAELLTRWHPHVAALAFRRWGLPPELDEPVLYHHDYTQADCTPNGRGDLSRQPAEPSVRIRLRAGWDGSFDRSSHPGARTRRRVAGGDRSASARAVQSGARGAVVGRTPTLGLGGGRSPQILGSVTSCCLRYFPFLSAYEISQGSSL